MFCIAIFGTAKVVIRVKVTSNRRDNRGEIVEVYRDA